MKNFSIHVISRLFFLLNYTYIHGKVGCKRVYAGATTCSWVSMGALGRRGHGGHKSKASRGHMGSCRSGFEPYGRGNFPGHHVFVSLAKSGANGCRWVCIGADGCGWMHGHRGKQKQDRKSNKWVRKACICNMCTPRNKAGSVQGWSWWLE